MQVYYNYYKNPYNMQISADICMCTIMTEVVYLLYNVTAETDRKKIDVNKCDYLNISQHKIRN